jgi:hypothetical protein
MCINGHCVIAITFKKIPFLFPLLVSVNRTSVGLLILVN